MHSAPAPQEVPWCVCEVEDSDAFRCVLEVEGSDAAGSGLHLTPLLTGEATRWRQGAHDAHDG